MAEIREFWVVTYPTEASELVDILFVTTPRKVGLQFLGGLRPREVVGFFTDEDEAREVAEGLLKEAGLA